MSTLINLRLNLHFWTVLCVYRFAGMINAQTKHSVNIVATLKPLFYVFSSALVASSRLSLPSFRLCHKNDFATLLLSEKSFGPNERVVEVQHIMCQRNESWIPFGASGSDARGCDGRKINCKPESIIKIKVVCLTVINKLNATFQRKRGRVPDLFHSFSRKMLQNGKYLFCLYSNFTEPLWQALRQIWLFS